MLLLDEQTRRDLRLDELLMGFEPYSSSANVTKQNIKPFLPGQEEEWQQLLAEQEQIEQIMNANPHLWSQLEKILRQLPDLSITLEQMANGLIPTLTEWFQIKKLLWQLNEWGKWMIEAEMPVTLQLSLNERQLCENLLWKLNPAPPLSSSFSITDEYDREFKAYKQQVRRLEQVIHKLKEEESKRIETQHGVRRNRLGEWVIERHSSIRKFLQQEDFLLLVRETVYDAVYVLRPTKEIREKEEEVQILQQSVAAKEIEIIRNIARELTPYLVDIQKIIRKVVHFDLQWARIRLAMKWNGIRPEMSKDIFVIEKGYHPEVAKHLSGGNRAITPIDIQISQGVAVIIGPNMGGKTVALKTVGLIAVLAQYGFLVPAVRCQMPLFPWVATMIGDQQPIDQGLSSFGAEISRLSKWLEQRRTGLLLLDEIGRGTNPVEGAALSEALTQYLVERDFWSIHVTHYQEVLRIKGIIGYRVAGLDKDKIKQLSNHSTEQMTGLLQRMMDYRLIPLQEGDHIPEQALAIAELIGLNREIIQLTKKRVTHMREEEADGR